MREILIALDGEMIASNHAMFAFGPAMFAPWETADAIAGWITEICEKSLRPRLVQVATVAFKM